MKRRLFLAAVGAALVGSAAILPAAAPPTAAPQQRDWTRTVVETPEGGFRMGNPDAAVKLVEYGSLTCPHCADFARSADEQILARVRSGKLSFEYRSFVLNGIDLTATLLARCAGPSRFFPLTKRMFETQGEWVGKIAGMPQAQKDALKSLPGPQQLERIADIGGLTQLAAGAGVAPAKGRQCLADEPGLDRLGQMAEQAEALGVQGTPTFLINGAMVHAHDWAELEPLIGQAGG